LLRFKAQQVKRKVWGGQGERCAEVLIFLRGGFIVKEKEKTSLPLNAVLDQTFFSLIQREHEVRCGAREPKEFIDSFLQLDYLVIDVSDRKNGFLHIRVL
jgi:hypothetical protein